MDNQKTSIVQKLYADLLLYAKRKIAALQKAYKAFIASMLKKYEVETIHELKDEQKHEFFTAIDENWPQIKEEVIAQLDKEPQSNVSSEEEENKEAIQTEEAETEVPVKPKEHQAELPPNASQKEEEENEEVQLEEAEIAEQLKAVEPQEEFEENIIEPAAKEKIIARIAKEEGYSAVKVSKPPVALEPETSYEPSTINDYNGDEIKKIPSEENPEQTNDLRIKYQPNRFFEQDELYTYPVVKMPRLGSYLKLPRKGRAMGRGYKEHDFYQAIRKYIHQVDVEIDLHMAIPHYNRPYEPDIVLINRELNLYIDFEIDEPYDGYYRYPTHCFNKDDNNDVLIKKDDTRDLFFNESGWVVIRFTERQVHTQQTQCIAYIQDVLNSLLSYHFEATAGCLPEPQWKYQQALRWEKEHYREKYLGIEKFGKQQSHSSIVVDVKQTEAIEENIVRTKKLQLSIPQDNVAFEEESHVYHHAKDATGNAEYISVTTLIDRFFPFDMDRFIQTKARREERDEEDVLNEFIEMRDEASETGTFLHEQIEHFLKGEPYNTSTNLVDGNKRIDISKEFEMFKVFHQQIVLKNGFEFIEAEKVVLLDDYNVAGTIDALFKKPNKDEYLIVDWKRSKKLVVDGHPKKYGYGYALSELAHLDNSSYYKYALQQNIYKYMLEKKYGMSVSSMNLIVLHEKFDTYHRVNLVNMDKEVSVIFNSINHKI